MLTVHNSNLSKQLPTSEEGFATPSDILTWLSTTDAKVTFVNGPTADVGGNVMVVYCSTRDGNTCGGNCTVYNGGATCLNAPNTNCLMATANVAFCSGKSCASPCNGFNSCGTRLSNNFCYTPGTNSIAVPFI